MLLILTTINDMYVAYSLMRVQGRGRLKGIIWPVRVFASRHNGSKTQKYENVLEVWFIYHHHRMER